MDQAASIAEVTSDITSTKLMMNSRLSKLSDTITGFHAGYFRIALSLSSQSLLWKTLAISLPHSLAHLSFLLLFTLSLCSLTSLSLLYSARCLLRFSSVRSEFNHHIGVNYFFAPFISSLLLLQSSPSVLLCPTFDSILCFLFSFAILILDVKIYGQWFTTKGKRFLSAVVNPTSQLSVIGNLVAARAMAGMGWTECGVGLFALGFVHYIVLFVTLYQRLDGCNGGLLPAAIRPGLFLFVGAPSIASLAWREIVGKFDLFAKMMFFLSLFLFACLVCRPGLFKRSMKRLNVAWWSYSFPLTLLALAANEYAREFAIEAHEVQDGVGGAPNTLMLVLSVLSVLVTFALLVFSALNPLLLLPRGDPFLPTNG